MANYRSKLASVLRLRTAARDAQQARVADALRAEAAIADQLSAVQQEFSTAKQQHRQARNGAVNVASLLEIERYELVLKTQYAALEQQRDAVAEELERRYANLRSAEQQVRVIEKLDVRRQRDFDRDEIRCEQAALDEIANTQFIRSRAVMSIDSNHPN